MHPGLALRLVIFKEKLQLCVIMSIFMDIITLKCCTKSMCDDANIHIEVIGNDISIYELIFAV